MLLILDKMKMLENPHRHNKNWYIEGNSRECLKRIHCGILLFFLHIKRVAKHEQTYLNGTISCSLIATRLADAT